MVGPSKSQVNKAGKVLRRWERDELVSQPGHAAALGVLLEHRAAHRIPLTKATMGLFSGQHGGMPGGGFAAPEARATIIDKLIREPTMPLASMQDIGGCRAVLASIDEVRRVQRRMSKNRPPVRVSDYIAQPRASGHRGVHLVVAYDDRAVEVQLRTRAMHKWAFTVERVGGRLGEDLKSGRGPLPVLDLLGGISEVMAIEEEGGVVDQQALDRLSRLRTAALPFLGGGTR